MHMENSLEVLVALEEAPREQGLLVLECLLRARSNDSLPISVMTILMYLLSIVASYICISNELGLYYQLLSPYLLDRTGNLESAHVLKKRLDKEKELLI